MSFSHIMFQLFIEPLQLIYEFIYYYALMFSQSTGVAIIALSIVVNFMLLPLYCQADAVQNKEREQQKKMEYWVKHIKKTFKGNERFMMTQTYYRQNNYKQFYSLRGMLPLVLEVPFFIAAYHFLSGMNYPDNTFGPISDLGAPDGLLTIGGVSINILPIIMTLINFISSAIYTKGLPIKDKLQLYGMAVLFLVLLYTSPSALVIYWTMNNIFSLVKNIIMRLKKPRLAALLTVAAIGIAAVLWSFTITPNKSTNVSNIPMLIVGICLMLPIIIWLVIRKLPKKEKQPKTRVPSFRMYFCGCLFLTLLTGLLIPSAIISSSPVEFVDFADFHLPGIHLVNATLLAAGMFLVWFGLLYYLSSPKARWFLGIIVWVLSGMAVVNYMIFNDYNGSISNELVFTRLQDFEVWPVILNLIVLIVLAVALCFVYNKFKRVVQTVYIALFAAVIGMSGMNIVKINAAEDDIYSAREQNEQSQKKIEQDQGKYIHLSKNGKNVVVLMMDRAASVFIPYIFEEKPEIAKQFEGFTYYPNTISYGMYTNFGVPAVYGGYEYTPTEMNKRSDERLADKHDEALKLMPSNFYKNGYSVTVVEPTYAGYDWIPNLHIYDEFDYINNPDFSAYNVEQGNTETALSTIWERNFFCHSLMQIAPSLTREVLYHHGNYYLDSYSDVFINANFKRAYKVLDELPESTACDNSSKNTFLMMSNNTTHEHTLLKEPEYEQAANIDNSEYDRTHEDRFTVNGKTIDVDNDQSMMHYQVNMAAMIKLGEWFDYMRKNGVWDNTRIIIVSDHGANNLCVSKDQIIDAEGFSDVLSYNALLMVKDFGSTEFKTDNTFMTNADTPVLAFDDLISDPVNPATGKKIGNEAKQGEQYVIVSDEWTARPDQNTFPVSQWYSVHDDLFDVNNWTKQDRH